MPDEPHAPDGAHDLDPRERRRLTGGQKLLLVVSVLVTIVGGALMVVAAMSGPPDVATGSAAQFPVAGLAASTDPGTAEPSALDAWSPAVFRLGFSFFVGFAIAYALRSFVKISIITIGIMLLALFGLQYAGIVDVDWSAMESHYTTVTAWLGEQTRTLTAFVQGSLPAAGSAAFGFATGFRRR